jgi:aspartate aminotransferase
LQLCLDADLLVPTPSWVTYAPQAKMLNRRTLWVETHRVDAWKVDPMEVEDALRHHAQYSHHYPKLFILNYPSNPTGASYTKEELLELADVFRRHNVVVLSDEIYGGCTFGDSFPVMKGDKSLGVLQDHETWSDTSNSPSAPMSHLRRHYSISEFYPEGTIILDGISKAFGSGGWRLGSFTFPSSLAKLRKTMLAAASETYSSVSAPIQLASRQAFMDDNEGYRNAYLDASSHVLSIAAGATLAALRAAGAMVNDPSGGFYVFIDFSACPGVDVARARFEAATGKPGDSMTSDWLGMDILTHTGVAMLPGTAFGRMSHELTFRLAFVDFDGAAAISAIEGEEFCGMPGFLQEGAVTPQQADFLKRFLPRIPRGMATLSRYLITGQGLSEVEAVISEALQGSFSSEVALEKVGELLQVRTTPMDAHRAVRHGSYGGV